MFKNYFKTAWRNIRKNKLFSAINILGLSIGIATCFIIMLYVQDELSYDRFNEKADRTYRVAFKAAHYTINAVIVFMKTVKTKFIHDE